MEILQTYFTTILVTSYVISIGLCLCSQPPFFLFPNLSTQLLYSHPPSCKIEDKEEWLCPTQGYVKNTNPIFWNLIFLYFSSIFLLSLLIYLFRDYLYL